MLAVFVKEQEAASAELELVLMNSQQVETVADKSQESVVQIARQCAVEKIELNSIDSFIFKKNIS